MFSELRLLWLHWVYFGILFTSETKTKQNPKTNNSEKRRNLRQTRKVHKEWLHSLRSCFGTYSFVWLLLVRVNVRKHTQANNVKNPPHVMQKVCDSELFSKLPLASILMAKSETIKANTKTYLLCFVITKTSVTFRLSWAPYLLGVSRQVHIFFEAQFKSTGSLGISDLMFVSLFVGSF